METDLPTELSKAFQEIERLRAALLECGASFISDPCTVAQGHNLLAAEFRRRMDIANAALERTGIEPRTEKKANCDAGKNGSPN